MSYPVGQGGEPAERLQARKAYEALALQMGMATLSIPLNGGSETRRLMRDYWRGYARANNIEYWSCGCMVVLGNRDCAALNGGRGHRAERSGHAAGRPLRPTS